MPQDHETMYRWRRWKPEARKIILAERRQRKHPSHSPAHVVCDHTSIYLLTAACFEHAPVIGKNDERIATFSSQLCNLIQTHCRTLFAWVVLPNHYHALCDVTDLNAMFNALGKLHGRTSFQWNTEDHCRGRQTWCKATETAMKSEGHFYASLNYVLHNPVHHGYCAKWTEWPFSSAAEYLENVGRAQALKTWQSYPLYDYGKDWDPPSL
jgi:putative transposase